MVASLDWMQAILRAWQDLVWSFNGQPHVLPGAAVPITFPRVDIGFDQGPPPQPLQASAGCEIRVVRKGRLK